MVIELAAALIGALALYVAPNVNGLTGAVFGWFLLTLAALDTRHQWLPDQLTLSLAALGLATALVVDHPNVIDRVIGGAAGFIALFSIGAVYRWMRGRAGLGGGDPKLLGAIGCWLGWPALPLVIFGASVVGLLAAIMIRLRGGQVDGSTALPLGSYMAVTAFPLWLWQAGTGVAILLQ